MAVRLPTVIEKLFPVAARIVGAVMERGARTHQGEDWRALPAGFHLARARRHLDLLAVGDVSEPHLAHAACRLLMELESTMKPKQKSRQARRMRGDRHGGD
jgi:hypothetical protein